MTIVVVAVALCQSKDSDDVCYVFPQFMPANPCSFSCTAAQYISLLKSDYLSIVSHKPPVFNIQRFLSFPIFSGDLITPDIKKQNTEALL